MPTISIFPIKTLVSQPNKRDDTQNQGDDSDVKSPVVMAGLVITALTLLVAMIVPLFRSPRFRRWVSSFSIPSFSNLYNSAHNAPRILTLPNLRPTTTTKEDLSVIPVADIPMPGPVLISNDPSNTFPYRHNVITRDDGSVPQVEESLGPRRPEPVVTGQLS